MEDRYLFKGKEKDSGKWLEWNAIADKPIKCDFASGMFVESED